MSDKPVLRKADGTPLTLADLPGGANNPHPTREIEVVIKFTVAESLKPAAEARLINALTLYATDMRNTQATEVRQLKAFSLNDLLFLRNEVHLAGDEMRRITPGDVFGSMTCNEAQSLADVFAAAGDQKTHDFIMESHARGDDDEEDTHHAQYLEIQENGGTL